MRLRRLLLVEPDDLLRSRLRGVASTCAQVDADAGAPGARARLLGGSYDWLVTNLRLEAYNGLHLAYLARALPRPVRIVVYGETRDLALVGEAQRLGAFFEPRARVAEALAGYFAGSLPVRDRRRPGRGDRRAEPRGGRRSVDAARGQVVEFSRIN